MAILKLFLVTIGISLVSISSVNIYFGNFFCRETMSIKPGENKIIEQNLGAGSIKYSLVVENNLELAETLPLALKCGINILVLDENKDAHFDHIIDYQDKITPLTFDVPEGAKLIIGCSDNLTGKSKLIIKHKEFIASKSFTLLENLADTTTYSIIKGEENVIYTNKSKSAIKLSVQIFNQLVQDNRLLIDEVTVFLAGPYRNPESKKVFNTPTYISPGEKQIVDYILNPGYSLNIESGLKDQNGQCYYKCLAIYN